MPKSKVTLYFEKRLKKKLLLSAPTQEDALNSLDMETGIALFKLIRDLQVDFDTWSRNFVNDSLNAKLPHHIRHLDTIQDVRRCLNGWQTYYKEIIEDYNKISDMQPRTTMTITKAI